VKELKPRSRDDNLIYALGKKVAFKTSVLMPNTYKRVMRRNLYEGASTIIEGPVPAA
jgi:hypothetical protein